MVLFMKVKKKMADTPDCSYAMFVKKKFPWVWENYLKDEEAKRKKGR